MQGLGIISVRELRHEDVAMYGSCSVCELRCVEVAECGSHQLSMCRSRGVYELCRSCDMYTLPVWGLVVSFNNTATFF